MYAQILLHLGHPNYGTDFLQLPVVVAPAELTNNKRKRASSEAPEISHTQKKRRGNKRGSHTEAVADVADAIQSLANNFSSSDSSPAPITNVMATTTPERRAAALKLIEDDGQFSEDDLVSVFCLFAHKKAVHDTFLSLSNEGWRTKYVRKELDTK
jgi:hypothetical protein